MTHCRKIENKKCLSIVKSIDGHPVYDSDIIILSLRLNLTDVALKEWAQKHDWKWGFPTVSKWKRRSENWWLFSGHTLQSLFAIARRRRRYQGILNSVCMLFHLKPLLAITLYLIAYLTFGQNLSCHYHYTQLKSPSLIR